MSYCGGHAFRIVLENELHSQETNLENRERKGFQLWVLILWVTDLHRHHQGMFLFQTAMSVFPGNGRFCFLWTVCLFISSLGQQGAQAFWCSNGVSLPFDHVCDFTDHCGDNSDEQQCKYHFPSTNSSSLCILTQGLVRNLGNPATFLLSVWLYCQVSKGKDIVCSKCDSCIKLL